MAVNGTPETLQVHRLPLSKYIDALRSLRRPRRIRLRFQLLRHRNPLPNPIKPLKSNSPILMVLTLKNFLPQTLHKPLIAASTFSGSLHVLLADPVDALIKSDVSVPGKTLHVGPISCIDAQENGSECVSVGEDGRVNLVSVGNSNLSHRRFFDSYGLVSYTAAKWASPMEFATGGLGFSLQWWDQRKPGGPASQFKGNWAHGTTSRIVHSIDIHPSRKHTCIAGGSSGTVFAWDLWWQQQPIVLSGVAAGEFQSHSLSESEIWEVQYDSYSSNIGNMSTSRVLPVMICSEDGILAVVEQGEEPIELLAEPCAINSFDIDRENPSMYRKK
ncbi:unnamed protein product [Camellia sinensis]